MEERTDLGIRALLQEMNVKAEEASLEMLAELTRNICTNILTDARTIATHADRTDIQPDDINYAARKYSKLNVNE